MDDPANNNAQGCLPYTPNSFVNQSDPNARSPYLVALVLRGGCRFGQKALMAQAAGASAIIVYTTQVGVQYPLPVMAGGTDTPNINIPGMLINYHDGATLLGDVTAWRLALKNGDLTSPFYDGVWVSLTYTIVAPDDRVEWDLYTYPDEAFAANFLQVMEPVVEALGNRAMFTPHYKIMDGSLHGWSVGQREQDAANQQPSTDASASGNVRAKLIFLTVSFWVPLSCSAPPNPPSLAMTIT